MQILLRYDILVLTLCNSGRMVSAKFPEDHFTHVFIDECGKIFHLFFLLGTVDVISKDLFIKKFPIYYGILQLLIRGRYHHFSLKILNMVNFFFVCAAKLSLILDQTNEWSMNVVRLNCALNVTKYIYICIAGQTAGPNGLT